MNCDMRSTSRSERIDSNSEAVRLRVDLRISFRTRPICCMRARLQARTARSRSWFLSHRFAVCLAGLFDDATHQTELGGNDALSICVALKTLNFK